MWFAALDVTSIHSYRMEAMALLAGMTTLATYGWHGKIEWHIDCTGVINTYNKLSGMRNTHWYAQRDKDVWEQLDKWRHWWGDRIKLHHVKAHADKLDRDMTPEEIKNDAMDKQAKYACTNTQLLSVTNIDNICTWGVYMHGYRVTGHTKTCIMDQLKMLQSRHLMLSHPHPHPP